MLITDYEDMYVILKVEVAALIKSYDLSIIDHCRVFGDLQFVAPIVN